ncbi:MAG: sigma-E factor negative regulatory protein [Panacagrimonas sp.]
MVKDSLSALLDGECTGPELDRLLDELSCSPELGREWSRLCLTREARAGTRVTATQTCICAGVMSRLDESPATPSVKVVDLAVVRAAKKFSLPSKWKPAVAFAAAASMGAAAVLLVQPKSGTATVGSGQTELVWGGDRRPDVQPVSNQDDAHAQMLRQYMMDHSSAVADEGVGSTLRYARFAAHTAEYRQQPEEQR